MREPSERLAFWLTALCAFPAALFIGYVLHESIGASQVALFIVIAMVYVTLARGRLLGSSVRVHAGQYPRIFTIVKRTCAALEIPMPLVFVREDNLVPIVALGFGEPYALVLSSHWIELFSDDEVAFMIGRELGHIAAGHTRFHSLLSVNGNENPLISLIFGAWLRRCALTCDKVGLLCCSSLDAAIRAMGVAAFHEFGRRVDYEAFAQQHAEFENDSVLRWGEWLTSEPYATRRIASLRRFLGSTSYTEAAQWFLRERSAEPPALAAPGKATVENRDCAGWWRRLAAATIDAVIVSAIITSFGGNLASVSRARASTVPPIAPAAVNAPAPARGDKKRTKWVNPLAPGPVSSAAPAVQPADQAVVGPFALTQQGLTLKVGGENVPLSAQGIASLVGGFVRRLGFFFWFPLYLALLVIVAGQTFGMMIAGLKVVTTDFRKPGIGRTFLRYLIVFLVWWMILPLSLIWRRLLLHDRWSKTRVVKVERVVFRPVAPSS